MEVCHCHAGCRLRSQGGLWGPVRLPKAAPTCAVGVGLDMLQDALDVLCLGQVHLQQRQSCRAALAQLLGTRTLQVQHAGKHPKAHDVQVPGCCLPKARVTS